MRVLTDEGPKPETFESRQAQFRTSDRLDRFLSSEISFGELEGLERDQLDWSRRVAWDLTEAGDFEAAHGILLALSVLDHRNADLFVQLAAVTARLGEPAEALPFFDRAIALAPEGLGGLVGRGELLLDLGRLEEGVADLVRAVELDPRDQSRVAARARMLLQGIQRTAALRLGDAPGDDTGIEVEGDA